MTQLLIRFCVCSGVIAVHAVIIICKQMVNAHSRKESTVYIMKKSNMIHNDYSWAKEQSEPNNNNNHCATFVTIIN